MLSVYTIRAFRDGSPVKEMRVLGDFAFRVADDKMGKMARAFEVGFEAEFFDDLVYFVPKDFENEVLKSPMGNPVDDISGLDVKVDFAPMH